MGDLMDSIESRCNFNAITKPPAERAAEAQKKHAVRFGEVVAQEELEPKFSPALQRQWDRYHEVGFDKWQEETLREERIDKPARALRNKRTKLLLLRQYVTDAWDHISIVLRMGDDPTVNARFAGLLMSIDYQLQALQPPEGDTP